MLESVLADVVQQFLQMRNLYHPNAAECIQRVAGEFSLADIAANYSGDVVGREAGKAHRARLHAAHNGAERVVLANRSRDDFLEVHADVLEEMLGQVAAMKADGLVWIVAVVVIPV